MSLPPLLLRHVDLGAAHAELDLLADHGVLRSIGPERSSDNRLFSLTDLAGDPDGPLAVALTAAREPGTVELRRFAVAVGLPEVVLVGRLIAALADSLRAVGCRRLIVRDDDGDADRAELLLAVGFTVAESQEENDMVTFELLL